MKSQLALELQVHRYLMNAFFEEQDEYDAMEEDKMDIFMNFGKFEKRVGLAMNDEKNFVEPEKFKPERWLRGCPGHHTAHPFAAIPFSFGPRMCIGRRFAELEVYVLAIKVLQRFRLEYHHDPVGRAIPFVCRPDKIIKMKFIPRT